MWSSFSHTEWCLGWISQRPCCNPQRIVSCIKVCSACISVYVYICAWTCIYACVHVYACVYVCACLQVCVYLCVNTCVFVCIHVVSMGSMVCVYLCICGHVYMYMCVYEHGWVCTCICCAYVHMYMGIYVHVHVWLCVCACICVYAYVLAYVFLHVCVLSCTWFFISLHSFSKQRKQCLLYSSDFTKSPSHLMMISKKQLSWCWCRPASSATEETEARGPLAPTNWPLAWATNKAISNPSRTSFWYRSLFFPLTKLILRDYHRSVLYSLPWVVIG